jgi:hypothetical protein
VLGHTALARLFHTFAVPQRRELALPRFAQSRCLFLTDSSGPSRAAHATARWYHERDERRYYVVCREADAQGQERWDERRAVVRKVYHFE